MLLIIKVLGWPAKYTIYFNEVYVVRAVPATTTDHNAIVSSNLLQHCPSAFIYQSNNFREKFTC